MSSFSTSKKPQVQFVSLKYSYIVKRCNITEHSHSDNLILFTFSSFFTEPMRTPKKLKIAETRSRLIAVDWESLGYNITRCHTFNVTICYQYTTTNNNSKAGCLDMDPKGKGQRGNLLLLHIHLTLFYTFTINTIISECKLNAGKVVPSSLD